LFYKRNRTRDPRVPEPKRSPLAIFNAACPFSSEFLVKVTFVSTRPGILCSRWILNHAKPSITAGGMKTLFQSLKVTRYMYIEFKNYQNTYFIKLLTFLANVCSRGANSNEMSTKTLTKNLN
jgi:hypothetical protein